MMNMRMLLPKGNNQMINPALSSVYKIQLSTETIKASTDTVKQVMVLLEL